VYLESGCASEAEALGTVLRYRGARDVKVSVRVDQDWMAGYRKAVQPFAVGGSWWIDPRPETPTPAPNSRFRLAVEPRTAFGSGSHESTQLVLLALEEERVAGRRVLDVGTGSGILALAACAMGADQVVGFDIDTEAVWIAEQTTREAIPECRPLMFVGPIAAVGKARFDVVMCNMISVHFLSLLADIRRLMAARGRALFSGMLHNEQERMRSSLVGAGFEVERVSAMGEWLCMAAVPRAD